MKKTTLALLAILLLLVCCSEQSSDLVTEFESDDIEMDSAIDQAQSSLAEFIERLQNPRPTDESFSVKTVISDGEKVERLWVTDVSYSGGEFIGTINEYPQVVRNVKFGQQFNVPVTEIIDWMYVDDDMLVGNFTLRVLLKNLPM